MTKGTLDLSVHRIQSWGSVLYLEADLQLLGWLNQELQAVLHHAGSCRAPTLPFGTVIKSFSTLALSV